MTLPDEGEEHGTHVKDPVQNGTALPNRNGLNGHTDARDSMRTPVKATGVNGRTPDKPFGDLGSTPDNPFIIDNVDPVTSDSDIDIDAVSVSKFLNKAKKDAPNGCPTSETGKEDELLGKRKRTVPKKFQSPYALDRPIKRQFRGSSVKVLDFDDKPAPDENSKPDSSSDLTPELVDAAIVFLELAYRSEQHKKKMCTGIQLAMKLTLKDFVIDGYLGHLALRVGHDRFLCPAWRSKFLVDRAIAGDEVQESSKNMDSAMARSGAVGRVLEEYTKRDKMTFVMHMPKQEFQVLNSLYPLDLTLETVEALRRQNGQDMQVANGTTGGNYPDVTKWSILEYDMPQQRDGNSCGLFVIECMEHWDGDRMSAEISHVSINARRRRVIAEMMLSPSNTLEVVKQKIRTVASKINKKS
ncbi:hypothetical protein ACQ4PT_057600 [Festuca glaucescens]